MDDLLASNRHSEILPVDPFNSMCQQNMLHFCYATHKAHVICKQDKCRGPINFISITEYIKIQQTSDAERACV